MGYDKYWNAHSLPLILILLCFFPENILWLSSVKNNMRIVSSAVICRLMLSLVFAFSPLNFAIPLYEAIRLTFCVIKFIFKTIRSLFIVTANEVSQRCCSWHDFRAFFFLDPNAKNKSMNYNFGIETEIGFPYILSFWKNIKYSSLLFSQQLMVCVLITFFHLAPLKASL